MTSQVNSCTLPGDIFVDKQKKLWRCIGICHEPTVIMEEVEGCVEGGPQTVGMHVLVAPEPKPVQITKARLNGGIGGLMWEGWLRIFRPNPDG